MSDEDSILKPFTLGLMRKKPGAAGGTGAAKYDYFSVTISQEHAQTPPPEVAEAMDTMHKYGVSAFHTPDLARMCGTFVVNLDTFDPGDSDQ